MCEELKEYGSDGRTMCPTFHIEMKNILLTCQMIRGMNELSEE